MELNKREKFLRYPTQFQNKLRLDFQLEFGIASEF
jgi:hypothetical protein